MSRDRPPAGHVRLTVPAGARRGSGLGPVGLTRPVPGPGPLYGRLASTPVPTPRRGRTPTAERLEASLKGAFAGAPPPTGFELVGPARTVRRRVRGPVTRYRTLLGTSSVPVRVGPRSPERHTDTGRGSGPPARERRSGERGDGFQDSPGVTGARHGDTPVCRTLARRGRPAPPEGSPRPRTVVPPTTGTRVTG